ncbi:polysaccharide deacetylase family protein [Streptomyces sp. CAU 1734]|uniref:polysaccharide deacetylase family protein n=1 Tax=Streptomyces sp. CAU 1734 TaxID=3140360 RepID=UPI0032614511
MAFLGSACAAEKPDGREAAGRAAERSEAAGKAAAGAAGKAEPGAPGRAAERLPFAERVKRQQAARAVAARKWRLDKVPLPAPEPPAEKPEITTRDGFEVEDGDELPPVFTTVPVEENVVFLTIDDGSEKDPELLRMMSDLQIPYSSFLSDYVINDNYGYFREMRDRGVTLHNHTLNHRYMPGLSYAEQKKEICGQQENLERLYGKRPQLFRPPYGNYNRDTLVAAKACGVRAVPLWAAEGFPDRMEWREWDKDLHPGDIILTHFRGPGDWEGTMPDMIRQVMKVVTEKGYAIARLEDYV